MIKLKRLIPQGYCLNCLGCCRFAERDSAWSPKLLEEEQKKINQIRTLYDSEQGNFYCAYLNKKNNKCKIYRLRPFDCRLYPFLINRVDKKVNLSVDLKCPFVKANLKEQEFKSYVRDLTGLIKTPEFLSMIAHNPGFIQIYEDVAALAEIDV